MWALVESGTVTQTFNELPSKLTVSNRNYDKAELTAMSDSERKAIGIYPVATAVGAFRISRLGLVAASSCPLPASIEVNNW